MNVEIKGIEQDGLQVAMDLVWGTFLEFEAPDYVEEGVATFRKCINDDDFISGNRFYGAYEKGGIVGVIATRSEGKHISLFFVEGKYHKQGIGRMLFEKVIEKKLLAYMTVNSSPYAVEIYRKLGFKETDREQLVEGMRFIPMKRSMIKLVRPTIEMEKQALEYRKEHFDCGEKIINGSELFDQTDCYVEWLEGVTLNTDENTVSKEWVLTDTFFAIRESDNRIVGMIDLRHTLNDFLKDFGNSGYSVRPSERRRGYATEMLRQLLEVARDIGMDYLHLSVERDNETSVKTIKKNGGVYERSFRYEGELADIYKIDIL